MSSKAEKRQKAIDKYFSRYDRDGSDTLDINEIREILREVTEELGCPAPTEYEVEAILKDYDKNNDRKISKEEFVGLYNVLEEMRENA